MEYQYWSDEEVEFLRKNFGKLKTQKIADRLGRSYGSVRNKARKENLSDEDYFWTEEEIQFLRDNYTEYSNSELEKKMDRTERAIAGKAMEEGITEERNWEPWTDEEEKYLKEKAEEGVGYRKIADELDREYFSVKNKAFRLDIQRNLWWEVNDFHVCEECGERKHKEDFERTRKEGEEYGWTSVCKECAKEREKRWKKEREEWYHNLKESEPCKDCRKKYPYYVMGYDHVRGEKRFEISRKYLKLTKVKILDEIEKCDPVCANCHAKRTHDRREN